MPTQFPGAPSRAARLRYNPSPAAPSPPNRRKRRVLPRRFSLACSLAGLLFLASPAVAEQWTSVSGTATLEAKFIGLWEGKVILERPNGSRVAIEKNKLAAASRLRADELAAEQEQQRQQRIAELRSESDDTVEEIPAAQAAGPYEPWPEGASLEESIEHVAGQLQAGHPRVLWDVLPPSYKQDVQSLVQLYADRTDAEQHATVMRLFSQLVRVLHKQREFILNYPMLAAVPPEMRATIEEAYTPVVGILTELTDPESFSPETLRTTDLDALIAEKDEAIGGYVASLLEMIPEGQNPLAAIASGEGLQVEMESEDRGTLVINDASGQPQRIPYVRVEGRWVPEETVAEWDAQIAQAREAIEKLPETMAQTRQQVSMLALTVGPALARLEDASTQEEFNAIIDSYVQLAQSMIPQGGFSADGQQRAAAPGAAPGGFGAGQGYGTAPGDGAGQGAGQGPGGGHGAQGGAGGTGPAGGHGAPGGAGGAGGAGPAGGHAAQGGHGAQGPGGGSSAPGGAPAGGQGGGSQSFGN